MSAGVSGAPPCGSPPRAAGPRGRGEDAGDGTTFAAAMLAQLGLPQSPQPIGGEAPAASGSGGEGASGSRSPERSEDRSESDSSAASGAARGARAPGAADSAAGRPPAHARESAAAGGTPAAPASEADARPAASGLVPASRRAAASAAVALPLLSADPARGAGPMQRVAPEGAAAALDSASRTVAPAAARPGAVGAQGRRGDSAMLRAARRTGRAPAFLPAGFVRRELASVATLVPPSAGAARTAAPAGPAGAHALADMTPALQAWEAQLDGTAAANEPISLRFEDADGASGTLRLRVQGEALRATLVTADPALAARLERDLGGLRQSLLDRGFTEARVQVAHAPQAGASGRGAETEDRRDGERASRDPQRGSRDPGGDSRPATRDPQQER